jgi:hypoxanthine-DNA glycosylase
MTEVLQGLAPIARRDARLLVLGSFPGVASLQSQQYYAHARNLFWPILSALWRVDLTALPYAQRIAQAQRHGLAIWDVYAACRRNGSLDSAIEDAQPNDLAGLVARLPKLRAIAHNGGESARAMNVTRALGLPVHRLPSTSPANASWSFERKLAAWREVFAQSGLLTD